MPDSPEAPRLQWNHELEFVGPLSPPLAQRAAKALMLALGWMTAGLAGCSARDREEAPLRSAEIAPPQQVVLAPVLNVSNSSDWDPVKVGDIAAAELSLSPGISVVPPNLARAALLERGLNAVRTPDQARDLARRFNADATVVLAVTHFEPFEPPRLGLIMQWYPVGCDIPSLDGESALERPADEAPQGVPMQVQRFFDAGSREVREDVKRFAEERGCDESALGWRSYVKSQEKFITYSISRVIQTRTQTADDKSQPAAP